MLTKRERDCLVFLIKYQAKNGGACPSFEEIKQALGLVSKSSIHRLVSALEERAFIGRLKGRARALTILRNPDGTRIEGIAAPPVDVERMFNEFAGRFVPLLNTKFHAYSEQTRNAMMAHWNEFRAKVKGLKVAL